MGVPLFSSKPTTMYRSELRTAVVKPVDETLSDKKASHDNCGVTRLTLDSESFVEN